MLGQANPEPTSARLLNQTLSDEDLENSNETQEEDKDWSAFYHQLYPSTSAQAQDENLKEQVVIISPDLSFPSW